MGDKEDLTYAVILMSYNNMAAVVQESHSSGGKKKLGFGTVELVGTHRVLA